MAMVAQADLVAATARAGQARVVVVEMVQAMVASKLASEAVPRSSARAAVAAGEVMRVAKAVEAGCVGWVEEAGSAQADWESVAGASRSQYQRVR